MKASEVLIITLLSYTFLGAKTNKSAPDVLRHKIYCRKKDYWMCLMTSGNHLRFPEASGDVDYAMKDKLPIMY